ncbi:MAG TPA: FMN-binding protein [Candidatus Binatia bacterium]
MRTERTAGFGFEAVVLATIATIATFAALATPCPARIFLARDEALKLAFPDADRVETRDVILTVEQHKKIEALAAAPLDSDLVTIYVGWKGTTPAAYAIFDTHTVRTFPETFLVVISPEGAVVATHILAFHEPEEYMPSPRWLATFKDRKLGDDLKVGSGVVAITGSTLSTHAVTSGIRRVLAVWNVVIGGK